MIARRELLRCWQAQLQVCQQHIAAGVSTRLWLWKIRRRIYRFLLAAYGRPQDLPESTRDESGTDSADILASDTAADDPEAIATGPRRQQQLVISAAQVGSGQPPKTGQRIRATLKSLHHASDPVEAGPLVNGLPNEDWILLATYCERERAKQAERGLQSQGIAVQRGGSGRQLCLFVHRGDFEAARRRLTASRINISFYSLAPARSQNCTCDLGLDTRGNSPET